jgi:hypothetical protein
MASLGLVLEQYPNEVVVYVTDPRTGVQRGCKWPPTIAEITEACDRRVGDLERAKRFATWGERNERYQLPPPIEEYDVPGRLAQVFVPDGHHRYAEFAAWSKTVETKWWKFGKSSDGRSGIWIPWSSWELGPQQISGGAQEARDRARRIIQEARDRNRALDEASQAEQITG